MLIFYVCVDNLFLIVDILFVFLKAQTAHGKSKLVWEWGTKRGTIHPPLFMFLCIDI